MGEWPEMDKQRLQRVPRLAALAILLPGLCLAGQDGKRVCSAKLRGRFWPEQANSDSNLAGTLTRAGDLEICAVRFLKYGWETPTVHISQLAKEREQKIAKHRPAAPRTD